jgi:hypothetical protein
LRLGRCAVAITDYEKALNAFRKAETTTTDAARLVEARVSTGEILFFSKKYAEAIEVLKGLTGGDTPGEQRARALYYLGRSQAETALWTPQ